MDWHRRFTQQAKWTEDLRAHLFEQAGIASAESMLEVGCGTGAILTGITTQARIHGLDIDAECLAEAKIHAPEAYLTCGDALSLPYPAQTFDICFCHFLLLWVDDPLQSLREMQRVTKAGGSVLALAEPDHGRRVDRPRTLSRLGKWQRQALIRQGADPDLGRRLAALFYQAGIQVIETGSLQRASEQVPSAADQELEWAVLEADLGGTVPEGKLNKMKELNQKAWEKGTRILYVPTHFCLGRRE